MDDRDLDQQDEPETDIQPVVLGDQGTRLVNWPAWASPGWEPEAGEP